jgi:RimJ/RimL family protein N-acetyltransferase
LLADAHSAEFGYWLAQSYRGRGLMPRVIRTFSDYAFQELRIHRLFATPFSSNLASHRALEKAGFQREGRNPSVHLGQWRKTSQDWLERREFLQLNSPLLWYHNRNHENFQGLVVSTAEDDFAAR